MGNTSGDGLLRRSEPTCKIIFLRTKGRHLYGVCSIMFNACFNPKKSDVTVKI